MPDQTHSAAQTVQTFAGPLIVPSGEDIYNALMVDIEPELVTYVLPTLEEKYKDESSEARETRLEGYQKAYEKYDQSFAQWMANLQQAVESYRKTALRSAEHESLQRDSDALAKIESSFSASS